MVESSGEEAAAAGQLDLEGAEHGSVVRVEAARPHPATETIPMAASELHLLTQRRVGRLGGGNAERLLALVPDRVIRFDPRLGTVNVDRPAIEFFLETGVAEVRWLFRRCGLVRNSLRQFV